MRVLKWGNSFAIRLPASIVEALELSAGDHIEVRVAGEREFAISRNEALERLRQLRRPLPAGFRFNRLEANTDQNG